MDILFFPEKNIILQIGNISLYFYGAMYALSAIFAYFIIKYWSKKNNIILSHDTVLDLIFWTMIGGVLGGRIFEILVYNLEFYTTNPLEILMVWHGGMSIHGGLIGGAIAFIVFCKYKNIPLGKISNCIAPALALGLMLGRLGNFMNDELYGKITEVTWGMDFGYGENRHPTQIYAMGKDFLLFLITTTLLFLQQKNNYLKTFIHAEIFIIFLASYGFLRAIVEKYKEIDIVTGLFWGTFTIGQILSIIMIIISIILWKIRIRIF